MHHKFHGYCSANTVVPTHLSWEGRFSCLQFSPPILTLCSELQMENAYSFERLVDSSWNVIAHGDAREGKWRRNWRMKWVASTLHTTSEHGVSSITTADAHTSAASSRLNWRTPAANLNGLVRFAERRNLVSARVGGHHVSTGLY